MHAHITVVSDFCVDLCQFLVNGVWEDSDLVKKHYFVV